MENLTPQQWAEGLRGDLTLGGERVPFERVLGHHLAGLAALRARGLTWRSLANLLRKNGVKRPDGRFYSADHLRVSHDRLVKGAESRPEPPRPSHRDAWLAEKMSVVTASQSTHHTDGRAPVHVPPAPNIQVPIPSPVRGETEKDLSTDELARIAARLSKLR
ncbi:hypothetical protein [Devosia sp. A369]